MSQIKERPILFSAPMVRAILEGRKTVTRREVKKQAALDCLAAGFEPAFLALPGNADLCPYGQPGDRLWVRETFTIESNRWADDPYSPPHKDGRPTQRYEDDKWDQPHYKATDVEPDLWYDDRDSPGCRWKPSIHMPRWASRILLEITDVRVERLQDISAEQAKAEGCFFTDYGQQCFHGATGWKDVGDCPAKVGHQQRNGWAWDKTTSHEQCLFTPRFAFANLWNATGGDWDANPWCWVVEFKRVTP
ncbi:hypothetical protein [Pseudomonas pergaminensis]|uniref:hypothetical protein n=1 Tax=Pseudomonas pergaminensis TaxID=2853159 RepID=UPI0034D62521